MMCHHQHIGAQPVRYAFNQMGLARGFDIAGKQGHAASAGNTQHAGTGVGRGGDSRLGDRGRQEPKINAVPAPMLAGATGMPAFGTAPQRDPKR